MQDGKFWFLFTLHPIDAKHMNFIFANNWMLFIASTQRPYDTQSQWSTNKICLIGRQSNYIYDVALKLT